MSLFTDHLLEALGSGQPFALGIISGSKGSSPQKKGAKAVFMADGRILGTLGGGCLEAEVRERARRAMASGKPATFDLVLDHDFGWDDGLICGGQVSGLILPHASPAADLWKELARLNSPRPWGVREDFSLGWADNPQETWLYRELASPPLDLWIAGSGHIAQAVAPLALRLEFAVTLFDDRPALANHGFFPDEVRLRVGFWEDLLREPMPSGPAFALVVTRGHEHDAGVLKEWIRQPFAFLGMIGSRRKARLIFDQFLNDKIASPDQISRVACPVGLAIGAVSPQEIAISILAQMIQRRAEILGEAAAR